jgi:hypothetical protein
MTATRETWENAGKKQRAPLASGNAAPRPETMEVWAGPGQPSTTAYSRGALEEASFRLWDRTLPSPHTSRQEFAERRNRPPAWTACRAISRPS